MIIPGREVLVKRLPIRTRNVDRVQSFDTDNLYPQRALETMYRSYTLSGIIPKKAGFLNGEGFEQLDLNEIVVHGEGLEAVTMRELLDNTAYAKTWAKGFAWHINYNLNYTIASIKPITFEYCRLGFADHDGNVEKIAYCTNWERDYRKEEKQREIFFYDKFDPSPEHLAEEFAEYGVEGYKGQILYCTPEKNKYPLCSFDSVFELAQTQSEIGLYALNQSANGFSAGHIFVYPGTFENDTERSDYKKRLAAHKGGLGAGSIMVIEAGTKDIKVGDLLAKTDLQNNDKMFEFTLNWIEKSILQNYGMPFEIVGRQTEGAMFSRQQIEDAYTYYNAVTRDERVELSRVFKKVFQFWNKPINSDFTIKPQVYDVTGAALPAQGATQQQAATTVKAVDEAQQAIDRVIRGLSRRDASKVFAYVNDFKNGRMNLEQAKTFLMPFLGTDANVMKFLQDPEGDGDA